MINNNNHLMRNKAMMGEMKNPVAINATPMKTKATEVTEVTKMMTIMMTTTMMTARVAVK
jgi:hypothetical protein